MSEDGPVAELIYSHWLYLMGIFKVEGEKGGWRHSDSSLTGQRSSRDMDPLSPTISPAYSNTYYHPYQDF